MYQSIPAGSLPSFSELESSDIHPGTPTSSIGDDIEWDGTSLDEMLSRVELLDKQISHLKSCVALLSHDGSCTRRLLTVFSLFCVCSAHTSVVR